MAGSLRTVCANLNKLATRQNFLKASVPSISQNASLVSVNNTFSLPTRTETYSSKGMNAVQQFIDKPFLRFDENSRVICVEGNLATGKHEFAKKIAKEFGMLYVPDIDFNKIWTTGGGFDLHELNESMKDKVFPDLEDIFMSKNPRSIKYLAQAQIQMLQCRMVSYLQAQNNLFRTGQGFVIVRSPFSDILFAHTLKDMNAITKAGLDTYLIHYVNMFETVWRPHMIIHLDASLDYCMDRIKKRNVPYEVNSPMLNREFLERLDFHFEHEVLLQLRRNLELVTYDPADLMDWDMIVEDLESYDLLEPEFVGEKSIKFYNWNKNQRNTWVDYFEFLMSKQRQSELFAVDLKAPYRNFWTFGQSLAAFEKLDPEDPLPQQVGDIDPSRMRREATA